MRKPIFIIELPYNLSMDKEVEIVSPFSALKEDYYVLYVTGNSEQFEFKMFSDKEIEPIELEKLKELLKLNDK